jgi:hypothetical protein
VPDTAYLDLGVAVGDIAGDASSVYLNPNPVRDILYVTWDSNPPSSLEVHTMEGKAIWSLHNDGTWTDGFPIDVSSLHPGMYIISCLQDGNTEIGRLIKL